MTVVNEGLLTICRKKKRRKMAYFETAVPVLFDLNACSPHHERGRRVLDKHGPSFLSRSLFTSFYLCVTLTRDRRTSFFQDSKENLFGHMQANVFLSHNLGKLPCDGCHACTSTKYVCVGALWWD